jgi:hypothetical protein
VHGFNILRWQKPKFLCEWYRLIGAEMQPFRMVRWFPARKIQDAGLFCGFSAL